MSDSPSHQTASASGRVQFRMLRIAIVSCIFCSCGFGNFEPKTACADDEIKRAQEKFFEQHVRPLLVESCFECHNDQNQKGGLRLDSIAHALAGGESGPAIDPHNPDESLLMEAVRYESYEMPPSGKLSDEKIAILEKWISMGAPWPGQSRKPATKNLAEKITAEDRQFWSFQPLADPKPPQVENEKWVRNEIDRFIARKLQEQNISPSEEASRKTLLRRLSFDLTGLPPTPEQLDKFLADDSPQAYEKLVDEFLSSPRYGEHWARFWLDLVRYAESDGFRKDDYRPDAWRYRDYVINSLNEDKPFDQFTREQIAGDEIAPHDPEALTATGFLRHGIYEYNQRDAKTQWQDMLNDITDTVGDTFLGMGMGCARCHDHKFDPILQKDYFRLQAFFANIALKNDRPLATREELEAYEAQLAKWKAASAEARENLELLEAPKRKELADSIIQMFPEDIQEMVAKPYSERTSYENQICELVNLQVVDRYATISSKFKGEAKKKWEASKAELAKFDHLKPKPLPTGLSVADYGVVAPPVFIPSKERLGEIAPGFLTIFDPKVAHIEPVSPNVQSTGRRTALANWLTRENHPLTTRVIVNRIWKEHFGSGIVDSPSDFGHLGELPTHPELLDWLATQFVKNGWSLKWLHREIVLSATYRQSAIRTDLDAEKIDPTNRLLWKSNVRRLEAEEIRDAQLVATGRIDWKVGGPGETASSSRRRSIYTKVLRNTQDPLLAAFDFPDRMTSSPTRNITTSPSQSLLLINGTWTLSRASELAKRVHANHSSSLESQLREAFQIVLSRSPSEDELQKLVDYLDQSEKTGDGKTNQISPQISTQVLEVSDGKEKPPVQTVDHTNLPNEHFTFSTTLLLRSIFDNSAVRTIASQWNGSSGQPGWGLGVTSKKSAYKPRHLILQLVGKNAAGKRHYEVIASNIHLELNHPYSVTVSVDMTNPKEEGVLFVVKDLISNEVQTSYAAHSVIKPESNPQPFMLGGRATLKQHKWDGWLDEVQLLNVALSADQITDSNYSPSDDTVVGQWNFDRQELPIQDDVHQRALVVAGNSDDPPNALIDVCHILLNSNEFIYID